MISRKKNGGRQKGTPNKTTSEMRDTIRKILSTHLENIDEDLEHLTPYQRIEVLTRLMGYCIPKMLPSELNNLQDEKIEVVFVKGKTIL